MFRRTRCLFLDVAVAVGSLFVLLIAKQEVMKNSIAEEEKRGGCRENISSFLQQPCHWTFLGYSSIPFLGMPEEGGW